jgi:predicted ATPase
MKLREKRKKERRVHFTEFCAKLHEKKRERVSSFVEKSINPLAEKELK